MLRSFGFDPKKEVLLRLVEESEVDHNCLLSLQKFQALVANAVDSLSIKDELTKAFMFMDHEKKGHVDVADLRRIDSELGTNLSEGELKAMIDDAGGRSSGTVTLEEFLRCAMSRNNATI